MNKYGGIIPLRGFSPSTSCDDSTFKSSVETVSAFEDPYVLPLQVI